MRPIRTAISLLVLGVCVWFAFVVPLGAKTLAEHVDAISETPPARELIDGTRATVEPALEDARDRVLGERVEAPTYLPGDEPVHAQTRPPADEGSNPVPGR